MIGYGVTCGLHTNANGQFSSTACKKTIHIGKKGITEAEARQRLKRWLILGTVQADKLARDSERQSHVGMGGAGLSELASEKGWADLDADLDLLLAELK